MIVLASAVATWLLRVALITLVPAHRLPAALRRALAHLAPAALAALVVTGVAAAGARPGPLAVIVPGPTHLALAVAGLVAWRFRSPALPVLAAVGVAITIEVLP